MTLRTKLPLFFIIFLVINLLTSSPLLRSAQPSYDWLKPGSYAIYSIGLNDTEKVMMVNFDDRATAHPVLGSYSWRCVGVEGKYAEVEVEVNITVVEGLKPAERKQGHVAYAGKEFYERAQNGDFSFIKRVPKDQVEGRMVVFNASKYGREYIVLIDLSKYGGDYWVMIPAPVHIYKKLMVTVDLDTLELVDENGKPWGKWAMWINPLRYPLAGKTLETFVMNWLNNTIDLYVEYYNGTSYLNGVPWPPPMETPIGRFERYFGAHHTIENELLSELGVDISPPAAVLHYAYEPRTGILLQSRSDEYLDDILTQKLGVILTRGSFIILETNVLIEHGGEFDLSIYLPYLALLGISVTIAGAYFIKRRRH